MLFMILAEDHADSLERRLHARPDHLARLEALSAAGRLVLAGPFPKEEVDVPGFSGSLIVADFEDMDAARVFAAQDPYVTAGVYAKVVVKPFKQVFPS